MNTNTYTHETVFRSIRKGATLPALDEAVEADLIREAQGGSEAAVYTLLAHYAPAVRNALARIGDAMERDDAEQEVLLAFVEAIHTHDATVNPRLAGRVADLLGNSLRWAVSATQHFSIATRTMTRYLSILKKADGDIEEAARLAPQYEMDESTFWAVTNATRTDSLQALAASAEGREDVTYGIVLGTDTTANPYAVVEDAVTVEALLSLLDEQETAIIRYAYGFDPVPGVDAVEAKEGVARSREEGWAVANDSVIARHMSLSRQKVQRVRSKALAKMRPHALAMLAG